MRCACTIAFVAVLGLCRSPVLAHPPLGWPETITGYYQGDYLYGAFPPPMASVTAYWSDSAGGYWLEPNGCPFIVSDAGAVVANDTHGNTWAGDWSQGIPGHTVSNADGGFFLPASVDWGTGETIGGTWPWFARGFVVGIVLYFFCAMFGAWFGEWARLLKSFVAS